MHIEVFVEAENKRCQAVGRFLKELGLSYTELNLTNNDVMKDFKNRLPGITAVPQIFIDGDHVGGYEDLLKIALEFAKRKVD